MRAVYFEVLTNPLLKMSDVTVVARVAHAHGALVIIDNTFVTPLVSSLWIWERILCCILLPSICLVIPM